MIHHESLFQVKMGVEGHNSSCEKNPDIDIPDLFSLKNQIDLKSGVNFGQMKKRKPNNFTKVTLICFV